MPSYPLRGWLQEESGLQQHSKSLPKLWQKGDPAYRQEVLPPLL